MAYRDGVTFDSVMADLLAAVPDTVDKREGSVIYDALAPAAAEIVKCYIELDVVMDETFVDTASLYGLMKRCRERAVPIRDASAAVIEAQFTPAEISIPNGARFNHDGVNYAVTDRVSRVCTASYANRPAQRAMFPVAFCCPSSILPGWLLLRLPV